MISRLTAELVANYLALFALLLPAESPEATHLPVQSEALDYH